MLDAQDKDWSIRTLYIRACLEYCKCMSQSYCSSNLVKIRIETLCTTGLKWCFSCRCSCFCFPFHSLCSLCASQTWYLCLASCRAKNINSKHSSNHIFQIDKVHSFHQSPFARLTTFRTNLGLTLFPWCQWHAMVYPKLVFFGYGFVYDQNQTSRSIRRTLMTLQLEYLSTSGFVMSWSRCLYHLEDHSAIHYSLVVAIAARSGLKVSGPLRWDLFR